MCKCDYLGRDDVFIPSRTRINNSKGKPIKGKYPTCRNCHTRLSRRQLDEIKKRGYYRSRLR